MNSIKNITLKLGGILFVAGFTFSCSVQKYQQPNIDLPENFRSNINDAPDTLNIAKINYRDFFKDPILVSLIDKAIEQNNDLKVALKQIEFASLAYKQSKWGNVPTLNAAVAGATLNRPSDNSMNGLMSSQFMGTSYIWDYNSSVSLAWEADIWGKIKGTKEEALAVYLQTQEAGKAVRTRLVSEVVSGYYNLLMLDKQLEISKENLVFADSTLVILKKQQDLGMITSLAVQQQEMTREQIAKNIPVIESSIGVQENALSILTGSLPDRTKRQVGLDDVYRPEYISTGVPSELLSYRPDVKSSELNVRRSAAAIHVAKVSMYPALNITVQGGLNAFKSSNWFNVPGSLFGIVSGAVAQPLLNGKQLKTKYKQAQITSEQAEIAFKQTVLSAVGEVSDALIQIEKLREQQVIAEGLAQKAEQAVNNAMILYQYDGATYLEVILAQSNKLQAELDLATVKAQELNVITALYRSLGGGWQ